MTVAGKQFGSWTVLGTDAGGRRATCCCACGAVRVIAVEALADGSSAPSCGCTALSRERVEALRSEAAQQRRQRDRDWRPQR